ncbi:hypothetical protein AWB75_01338 [Caballeronia catudaia]|uniref:Uncharacterized protein n=1 Tax=Caballeronia catudaia TaxID=1777136 RepID=A0A157ZWT6_9BURK|nr:hypothetical protein [Caballeronia catudaia]SAK49959.1 hypothetical protein AWB75_01338 [Caballeronia catudaia]
MAARKPRRTEHGAPSLFALAERQIVALYDAGVMSPAVLHHVVAGYADSGIDWNEEGTLQTVDGHTVQQAVVLVMMPARGLKSAQKDFMSVVAHLAASEPRANAAKEEAEAEPEEDEDLLSQLSGDDPPSKSRAAAKKSTPAEPKRAAFNPLVGARAVQARNKR